MKLDHMQDITAPEHGVQVHIREDSSVLWIHVDGITVLRICRIPKLEVVKPANIRMVPSRESSQPSLYFTVEED